MLIFKDRLNKYFHYSEAGTKKSKVYLSREEIEPKYKWNLEDIFESENKWLETFEWIKSKAPDYSKYKGRLSESSETLAACLKLDEEIGTALGKLLLYAMLSKDIDLSNSKYTSRFEECMVLYSLLDTESSYIRPELLEIPEDKLRDFIEENEFLQVYKHYFEDLLRKKEHTLSAKEEEILALASPVTTIPYNTFSIFENSDIEFPKVIDEKGNEVELTHGLYTASLYSLDRDYRQRVYKNYYIPFIKFRNTLVTLFNGNIKTSIFNAKARKYKTTLEASLDPNNIPVVVYDNLVNTVADNLAPLHRWAEIKKKKLGVSELHPYDSYVTLFPDFEKEFTYDESKEILLDALKPLGEQYLQDLKKAFDNRWIDVFETKGKRNGAYSSGVTYGTHPYVLLNWHNQLNDLFTFAHEMGHNMHSYYTAEAQPYPYANYSIFNAEITSTLNEALLLDYLIAKSSSEEEKLALIEKHLNNVVSTFYRQTMFADFEKYVHKLSEEGQVLTPEALCEIYHKMFSDAWGAAMTVDEEESYTWARVPHFYYNFYVYQYATSFAASQDLVEKLKTGGQEAVEKYLEFLKAGGSKYPLEVLADAGVDMTKPDPVKAVVSKMNNLLDQMQELL